MTPDRLGLFDTPPSRRQIRLAIGAIGGLVILLLVTWPVGDIQWPEIEPFLPMLNAIMFVGEMIVAGWLLSQARIFRSRALTVLASTYFFAALLLVPHTLTFPGALAPAGLLDGGINTAAWIAMFRRLAFPFGIAVYAALTHAELEASAATLRPPPRLIGAIAGAFALSAAATALAIRGDSLLPPIFLNRTEVAYANLALVNGITIALCLAAMALLWRRRISVLDLWLMVALSGWLLQSIVNLSTHARFTIGWYGLLAMMLTSSLVVMLALIAESNRLHARLALATAARKREREAQLMSMDALTAAIAHEVGQPLTGAVANSLAGLEWVTRPQPDLGKASQALQTAIDDGRRTTEVINSIRSTFSKTSVAAIEFSLNDLVRETAAFLDRELAFENVSLELSLDETLPPIVADRVQIQRVLVNLLTNAIESMSTVRHRRRRIAVRSAPLNGEKVILQISDTGPGIEPQLMKRIFEPFFTTKATGTGLGLSLCRSIIEHHGGRLWASAGERHGATFHIELPRKAT